MFQWLNYSCKAQSTFCNRVLVKQNSIVSLHILGFFWHPHPQTAEKIIPAQHIWFQYYLSIVADNKMPINIIVCGKVNLYDLFLNFLFPYRASKAIQMNNLYAILGKKNPNILLTLPMSLDICPIIAFCSFLNC